MPKSIYQKQWGLLIEYEKDTDISALNLTRKTNNDYKLYHRNRDYFDKQGGKKLLIKNWEKEYGIEWPKYGCTECCRTAKSCHHHLLEAHHVIPLGYNGPNEWWNIFPLSMVEHTGEGGIHSSEEAKALFSKVQK